MSVHLHSAWLDKLKMSLPQHFISTICKKKTITHRSCSNANKLLRVGGRGASVSACAGLTNQLLSCWVDPRIAWKKHWHSNCKQPVDGGGGTPRHVLLTCAKKAHLGCLISCELPMGFQNFVSLIKFILKKNIFYYFWFVFHMISNSATVFFRYFFNNWETLDEKIIKQMNISCTSIDSLLFSKYYLRKKNKDKLQA